MKPKLWMSWWWNTDLYYCKIPSKSVFDGLLERMQRFTTAGAETWFSEITLLESEPQIGEYLPRKKLEVFLDNMDRFKASADEHTAIETMQDILDEFLITNGF